MFVRTQSTYSNCLTTYWQTLEDSFSEWNGMETGTRPKQASQISQPNTRWKKDLVRKIDSEKRGPGRNLRQIMKNENIDI